MVNRAVAVIAVVVVLFLDARTQAQTSPTLEVGCQLKDIRDNPRDEEISAIVEFSWKATGAKYVLITGFDNKQHPVTGSIDTRGGEYEFLAVSDVGLSRVPQTCFHSYRPGTGRHGLIHSVNTGLDFVRYFRNSYRGGELSTTRPESYVSDKLIELLQGRNYTAVPDLRNRRYYTQDFEFHPSLCEGNDCDRPVGRRVIERQVAFDIWLEKLTSQSGSTRYSLHILPTVMLNYRLENRDWSPDPDALQVARPVCAELAEQIRESIR